MTEARGEVYDIGYQHYAGSREGRARARKALWMNGIRTALGLGRGPWAKLLPALLFFSVMVPALVLGIIASSLGLQDAGLIKHSGYYQIVLIILLLFSAAIGPELLCPDRRDNVISLYLVRPLTTTDYVIGRWLAFMSVTLVLVYLGQVVLFVGLTLAAESPWDHIRDNWVEVPKFLAAGLIVAAFTSTIPLAVSAFTTRKAYAAAFVIGIFIISIPVAGVLSECSEDDQFHDVADCEPITGSGAKWVALLDLGQVPNHVNKYIFDEPTPNDNPVVVRAGELPAVVPWAWYFILTAGPGLVLWWRYRSLAT